MSMSVNWTLNFPEVSFHDPRVMIKDETGGQTNPDWDPAQDLRKHLEQWAPKADRFGGDDDRNVRRRDEGRCTIMERLKFHELEPTEVYDDEGNITLHRVWKMDLISTAEIPPLQHANGQEFHLDRTGLNELYVNRMNPINYLYDWLLTLSPRGRWGNAWLVSQVGVTEYDESVFNLAIFHEGGLNSRYLGGSELTSEGATITRDSLREWIE